MYMDIILEAIQTIGFPIISAIGLFLLLRIIVKWVLDNNNELQKEIAELSNNFVKELKEQRLLFDKSIADRDSRYMNTKDEFIQFMSSHNNKLDLLVSANQQILREVQDNGLKKLIKKRNGN